MPRWLKRAAASPLTQLAGLIISVATLLDFRGALSALIALYPAAKAVAPILALAGTILFGLMITIALCRWCWEHRPAARFHAHHRRFVECRDQILTCIALGGNYELLPLKAKIMEVRQTLIELAITPPRTPTNNTQVFLAHWADFMGNLVPLAEHSRLREARKLWERMDGDSR